MADGELKDNNLTQAEFDRLSASMELDLTAFFNIMMDDVEKVMRKSVREKWTPERLVREINDIIEK